MRYLITGGAGFIGSHLADALVARGDAVTVLDDFSTGRIENLSQHERTRAVEIIEGSVLDAYTVDRLVARADVCLHLASAVGVRLIVSRPLETLQRNIRGNDVVISAAARHDKRLVFTSTSEVYGKNSADALKEDSDRIVGSPLKSRWAYATAKAYGEALVHAHFREQGTAGTIVRLFNTVGPRQTGAYGMVVPNLVRQALAGEALTVFGDGMQSRCFVHVADTVRALLLVCDHDGTSGQAFNIGNPVELAIVELARRVIERTGSQSEIALVPYSEAYGEGFEELGRRKPDITAVSELTGWRPLLTIEDAIDDVIAYQRAEPAADTIRQVDIERLDGQVLLDESAAT